MEELLKAGLVLVGFILLIVFIMLVLLAAVLDELIMVRKAVIVPTPRNDTTHETLG